MADLRAIVHFSEARLVALPKTAYIELEKPELPGGQSTIQCSFCNKENSHEHEFQGRIKFVARENKYFVSFIKTTKPAKRPREKTGLSVEPIPRKRPKSAAIAETKTVDESLNEVRSVSLFCPDLWMWHTLFIEAIITSMCFFVGAHHL